MIPGTNSAIANDLEMDIQPSYDFRLHFESQKIKGIVEEVDAVKQAIFMILNTERYEYLIYSWDYGIELNDLFGEPVTYVCPEIERRVTEALTMDERIIDVTEFEFDISQYGIVSATFIVNTIHGDFESETVVNI